MVMVVVQGLVPCSAVLSTLFCSWCHGLSQHFCHLCQWGRRGAVTRSVVHGAEERCQC